MLPNNPPPKSFEDGQKMMTGGMHMPVENLLKFQANISDNPLRDAFDSKVTVHPHTGGRPLLGEEARKVIDSQYDKARSGTGLAYLHIPFCETRCLYCLFYQNPLREGASKRYTDLLIKELQLWADRAAQQTAPIHAVYFGGGTPTALEADDIYRLVTAVKTYLPLANDCEITLEGRIHHFPEEKMESAFKAGVNRVSLGVQTFNAHVRQTMRRVDDRDTMIAAIEKLVSYDQASIVCDLIYGFPYQDMAVWEDDVKTASELPLDGVDCYQLNVFEKSPLGKFIANGKLPAGADKAMRSEMFARSIEILSQAQWRRLSNNHWGRTFRERNLYNRFGKSAADCLAFGCGAGGKIHGYSFMMERKLDEWEKQIQEGIKPIAFATAPTANWHALRTISSEMELGRINMQALGRHFDLPLAELSKDVFDQWTEAGLLTPQGPWHVQTVAGQFWHVTMSQLLMNVLWFRLKHGNAAKFF